MSSQDRERSLSRLLESRWLRWAGKNVMLTVGLLMLAVLIFK